MVEFLNETGSSQLEIVASRSKFFLSTLPKEDFPIMATEEYDFEFTLKSKVIKRKKLKKNKKRKLKKLLYPKKLKGRLKRKSQR